MLEQAESPASQPGAEGITWEVAGHRAALAAISAWRTGPHFRFRPDASVRERDLTLSLGNAMKEGLLGGKLRLS